MERTRCKSTLFIAAVLAALGAHGCMSPSGNTVEQKRTNAEQLRKQVVEEFLQRRPDLKQELDAAPGYIAGTVVSLHPGLFTAASGYGVVFDRAKQQNSYYRQGRFAVGPGLAVKGAHLLVIIHDPALLKQLEEQGGWVSGALAEASLKFGDFGGSATGMPTFSNRVSAYTWTHTGASLEVAIGSARISPDDELNKNRPIRGADLGPEGAGAAAAPAAGATAP